MKFRKATVFDISLLIKLRKQQLKDEDTLNSITEEELNKYFLSNLTNNSLTTWISLKNNEIIATCAVSFHKLPPSIFNPTGHVAYIINMFTLKEHRRQGIASHLLNLIIKEARNLNYKIIWLKSSDEARALYTKHGFEILEDFMVLELK